MKPQLLGFAIAPQKVRLSTGCFFSFDMIKKELRTRMIIK